LAKAGREQNYAAGAAALLGLTGDFGAIASLGSKSASFSRSVASADSRVTTLANYYPPNGGALGKWTELGATVGQVFSKYGTPFGTYASDVGVPFNARALPYGTSQNRYFEFEAIRPFMMESSYIGTGFGKIGYGIQYRMPLSVFDLGAMGYIKNVK